MGLGSAAAQALANAGSVQGVPVPLGNLSVRLEVPFRDIDSGAARTQSFVGTLTATASEIIVVVDVLGEWARLLYGSLAYPGFQSEPARLKIAYAFTAYVPISEVPLRFAYTNKVAAVLLVSSARDVPAILDGPALDISSATVHLPGSKTILQREASPQGSRAAAPPRPAAITHLVPATTTLVATQLVEATPSPSVVAHPHIRIPFADQQALQRPIYATQSIIREESVDVVFDCATFGPLYLQESDQGPLLSAAAKS